MTSNQSAEAAGIDVRTGSITTAPADDNYWGRTHVTELASSLADTAAEESGENSRGRGIRRNADAPILDVKGTWTTRRRDGARVSQQQRRNDLSDSEETIFQTKQRLASRQGKGDISWKSPVLRLADVPPVASGGYSSSPSGGRIGVGESRDDGKREESILNEKERLANHRSNWSGAVKKLASPVAAPAPAPSVAHDDNRGSHEEKQGESILDEKLQWASRGGNSGSRTPKKLCATSTSNDFSASQVDAAPIGDTESGNQPDGEQIPGAFAVPAPGLDEEEAYQTAAPSADEGTAPPILEGTLADSQLADRSDTCHDRNSEDRNGLHHDKELVYDGVAVLSEKDARGGSYRWLQKVQSVYDGLAVPSEKGTEGSSRRWLKKVLLIAALFCLVGVVAAVTVTLSIGNSTPNTKAAETVAKVSFSPSLLPTSKPTEEKELTLKELMAIFGDHVNNADAPYVNATYWFLNIDEMQLTWDSPFLSQRYTLALLYFSTGGAEWRGKRFLTSEHECSWYGIECHSDGFVRSIAMAGNNMVGTLPSDLAVLSLLERMDFSRNRLEGTVPIEVGRLISLKELHLFANGEVDPLGFTTNGFSGSLPSSINSLSSLEVLAVANNTLSGTLPIEFYDLTSLTKFYCGYNSLSGTISTLISQLSNLERFYICGNVFTGSIPADLAKLENIRYICAQWNAFTGTVSEDFCHLEQLWDFRADCGPTNFTGPPAVECVCCTRCCDTSRQGDWDGCEYMEN